MEIKTMFVADIKKCPTFIMLPSHYREDGSCRHDEPNCEEVDANNVRCLDLKYNEEIYCKPHLEIYGYEE